MKLSERISRFFKKYLFNSKWQCVVCNREVFSDKYFCDDCRKNLPIITGNYCQHCGRKLKQSQNYCTTCKGKLTSFDKARSVYEYKKPISSLIKRLKYNNSRYLVDAFIQDLVNVYYKNYFNADFVVYVPMTKKAKSKRGYNQSELLAQAFSEKSGLPILDCLVKVKETNRQVTLNKENRIKNIKDAFKVINRKQIKDKNILILDDVSTTGATAQAIAECLKKANAKAVYLLTIASVTPKDGY